MPRVNAPDLPTITLPAIPDALVRVLDHCDRDPALWQKGAQLRDLVTGPLDRAAINRYRRVMAEIAAVAGWDDTAEALRRWERACQRQHPPDNHGKDDGGYWLDVEGRVWCLRCYPPTNHDRIIRPLDLGACRACEGRGWTWGVKRQPGGELKELFPGGMGEQVECGECEGLGVEG